MNEEWRCAIDAQLNDTQTYPLSKNLEKEVKTIIYKTR